MIRITLAALVILVAINGWHHSVPNDLFDSVWIAHLAHWSN